MGFGANAVLQRTEGIPAMQKHPPCAPELSESPQHLLQSKAAAPSEALTAGGCWRSMRQTHRQQQLCSLVHKGIPTRCTAGVDGSICHPDAPWPQLHPNYAQLSQNLEVGEGFPGFKCRNKSSQVHGASPKGKRHARAGAVWMHLPTCL